MAWHVTQDAVNNLEQIYFPYKDHQLILTLSMSWIIRRKGMRKVIQTKVI